MPTENEVPYIIPLELQGVASSFPTRKPTVQEYETLPHLCLTSDNPLYDPSDPTFAQQEHALIKAVLETGDQIGAQLAFELYCIRHCPVVSAPTIANCATGGFR